MFLRVVIRGSIFLPIWRCNNNNNNTSENNAKQHLIFFGNNYKNMLIILIGILIVESTFAVSLYYLPSYLLN